RCWSNSRFSAGKPEGPGCSKARCLDVPLLGRQEAGAVLRGTNLRGNRGVKIVHRGAVLRRPLYYHLRDGTNEGGKFVAHGVEHRRIERAPPWLRGGSTRRGRASTRRWRS